MMAMMSCEATRFYASAFLKVTDVRATARTASLSLAVALAACKTSAPQAPTEASEVAELKSFVFKHEGIVRKVGVFDPRPDPAGSPRPLIVVLHGGLGDDDDTVALSFGKLNALAGEDDFMVVYPMGVGGHWNDGRNVQRYVAQRERVNDVGFLSKLVGDVIQKRNIDPEAVFVVGVSDGAMMAHRFACERGQLLRGFVAVIGAMPYNVARRRSRCTQELLSALMINGTEDPIVPWDGGTVKYEDQDLGRVLPVERTFSFWMRHNACEDVTVSMLPDFVPTDGTRVERRKAEGCADAIKVELLVVQGAGHTWPSGWQYLPEAQVGPISRDIDAAVAAWRFFQSTL
jgi:polyhydroxybutyrate depolymerase